MKIEYILLFEKEGIPIYSHCFGMFCSQVGSDDNLLSGFLSAITSMPEMFGQPEESMQSLEMDYTKLVFRKTEGGVYMVVGVNKDLYSKDENEETLDLLFEKIEDLLEEYDDVNWSIASEDERYGFEHKLVDGILPSTLDVYEDYCRAGDDCLFDYKTSYDEDAELTSNMPIWERLKKRYEFAAFPWIINLLLRPLQNLLVWWDRRDYRKRKRKLQQKQEGESSVS